MEAEKLATTLDIRIRVTESTRRREFDFRLDADGEPVPVLPDGEMEALQSDYADEPWGGHGNVALAIHCGTPATAVAVLLRKLAARIEEDLGRPSKRQKGTAAFKENCRVIQNGVLSLDSAEDIEFWP
jgi:hypothetical protein